MRGRNSKIRATANFSGGMRWGCDLRTWSRDSLGRFDLGEEAVAAPGNGFHKAGTFSRIAEGGGDFFVGFVEPMAETKNVCAGQDFFLRTLASYASPGVLKQDCQHLEGLLLN